MYQTHFWPGWRQADCCYDVRSVLLEVALLRCYSIGISRILTRERGHFGGHGYQKMFYYTMQKPNRTLKHDPELIQNKLINFNVGLIRLRRKKKNIWRIMMPCPLSGGKKKPSKTPTIVENIASCLNHIRGYDVCQTAWYVILYFKPSCKAKSKNDKDLG